MVMDGEDVATEVLVARRTRLDRALAMPARALAELCREGRVRIVTPSQRVGCAVLRGRPYLEPGSRAVVLGRGCDPRTMAEDIPLEMLFDDGVFAAINKPARLVTHPGAGHPAGTVANALRGQLLALSDTEGPMRHGIVHRLDLGTSGALLVARTNAAHEALVAQLAGHTLRRTYLAWVQGLPLWERTVVENHLGQKRWGRKGQGSVPPSRGKRAKTGFRVVHRDGAADVAVVEATPHTGRRHQVRAHLAEKGHPIVGDTVYGGAKARHKARSLSLSRPALHAVSLELFHPVDRKRVIIDAPLPEDLQQLDAAVGERDPSGATRAR